MSNEKRRITYWRIMPKGSISFVDVVCEVRRENRIDGTEYETFRDQYGESHHPYSQANECYKSLDMAIKSAKKKIAKAESNARATLLSCEMRRIRLNESIEIFGIDGNDENRAAIAKATGGAA